MRILIDARLYGLENAGLGRYINNLIGKLAEIDKSNQYIVLLRKKYFQPKAGQHLADDLLNLPPNWKKVLADYRHYSFTEQFLLPSLIKKENPDLVHFPHFNVPIFYRGNFIVTIHDLLMHQQKGIDATTLSAPNYYIKRLGYNLVFNQAVRNSKTILVPSQTVKNELLKKYKLADGKIIVTYEGVDNNIIKQNPSKVRNPYFLYAGNAYPHKNLKRLIQSMVLLNTNYNRPVTLKIVSARNNFTQRLEKIIYELKASKYIEQLGFVDDTELGSLLINSVGFVFPSLSEGFGLPGLEAMNLGTLLLASEIPVFKEIYKNHALYFNQLDFSSIEKTMRNALEMTKEDREKVIKDGQEFVKRYSWDKMAEQTLESYEETFKTKGSNNIRSGE